MQIYTRIGTCKIDFHSILQWASPKTVIVAYVRRHTPATAFSRQPQTTQTREPWPYQVDFGTTISNSFIGQISYLRRGNPL